jgi:hypothetical protein
MAWRVDTMLGGRTLGLLLVGDAEKLFHLIQLLVGL